MNHFHVAVQLLHGLSLNLWEPKYAASFGSAQTLFWQSPSLGNGLRQASLSRERVWRKSAIPKSNQVSPPAMNYFSPRMPFNFLRQGSKVLKEAVRACSKVAFSLQVPQTSWMYLGWKSLQTPWAVANSTCSSASRPRRSILPPLWHRQMRMASLSAMSLSPSIKQGKVRAGFLSDNFGLSSLNHLALPSAPSYLSSSQGMERYSSNWRMRSASPRIAQYPSVTFTYCSIRYVYQSIGLDLRYEDKLLTSQLKVENMITETVKKDQSFALMQVDRQRLLHQKAPQ